MLLNIVLPNRIIRCDLITKWFRRKDLDSRSNGKEKRNQETEIVSTSQGNGRDGFKSGNEHVRIIVDEQNRRNETQIRVSVQRVLDE